MLPGWGRSWWLLVGVSPWVAALLGRQAVSGEPVLAVSGPSQASQCSQGILVRLGEVCGLVRFSSCLIDGGSTLLPDCSGEQLGTFSMLNWGYLVFIATLQAPQGLVQDCRLAMGLNHYRRKIALNFA